uniref:Uncharacterized protein n=1 Tax=Knufia peltigerae TaxID=1002370 RepID=A0AA38XK69_9EURO|nr:hypothetical protein H2204_014372 [Knufia peltigerae]
MRPRIVPMVAIAVALLLMGSVVAAADSVLHPFLAAPLKQAPLERKTDHPRMAWIYCIASRNGSASSVPLSSAEAGAAGKKDGRVIREGMK